MGISTGLGPKNRPLPSLLAMALLSAAFAAQTLCAEIPATGPALPDAPLPQIPTPPVLPPARPCEVKRAGAALGLRAACALSLGAGIPGPGVDAQPELEPDPCPASIALLDNIPLIKNLPIVNWYSRFIDGPQVKPLTPREKGWLAIRNVVDPFNIVTILGSSAIAVGSDADSPYGPGMTGFGKYVGVSFTQDITGEFFGTFLISSVAHQDPHYHRMPDASMKRRIAHAIYQIAWTQGDNGKGMINYSNLLGYAIDDEISNLYVPGRETNLPASAARYSTGLATAPIDNFVSEFLPDLARHIHVQIVVIQHVIDQVAKTGGTNGQP
jgi:hypothetical protein